MVIIIIVLGFVLWLDLWILPMRAIMNFTKTCVVNDRFQKQFLVVFCNVRQPDEELQSILCCPQLVTRMQMLNKGCGVISWRLRGQLGMMPIDIDFQSTFELDLITGRVCPSNLALLITSITCL